MFGSMPFSGDTEFWKHQLSLLTSFTTRLTSSFLSIPCRTELGPTRNGHLGCWEQYAQTITQTSYILKHMDTSSQRKETFPRQSPISWTAGCLLQSKVGRVDTLQHLQISTSHQTRNLHALHAAPPLLTRQKILWSSLWTRQDGYWMLEVPAPKWEAAHHGKSHRSLICPNKLQSFPHSDLESSWKPKATTFFYYAKHADHSETVKFRAYSHTHTLFFRRRPSFSPLTAGSGVSVAPGVPAQVLRNYEGGVITTRPYRSFQRASYLQIDLRIENII